MASAPGRPAPFLPIMKTDIVLEQPRNLRRVVIETKFTDGLIDRDGRPPSRAATYTSSTPTWHHRPVTATAPATTQKACFCSSRPTTVTCSMRSDIQGHRIRFLSVDLSQRPAQIRARWMQCLDQPVRCMGEKASYSSSTSATGQLELAVLLAQLLESLRGVGVHTAVAPAPVVHVAGDTPSSAAMESCMLFGPPSPPDDVRRVIRSTHRLQRGHRFGVVVIEQVRVDRQRRRHLRVAHEAAKVVAAGYRPRRTGSRRCGAAHGTSARAAAPERHRQGGWRVAQTGGTRPCRTSDGESAPTSPTPTVRRRRRLTARPAQGAHSVNSGIELANT